MKLLPNIQLPQLPPVSGASSGMTGMDSRIPQGISLPFSPTDLLWRYGPAMSFSPTAHPPPSPLLDFKTHLPSSLGKLLAYIPAYNNSYMHANATRYNIILGVQI